MSKIVKKSFSNPDVKPDFPKVDARTLEMGDGVKVSRVVAEHGWKWSECVKPTIGTDSCQASHIGVLAKGNMTVRMDDGTEVNYEAGDAYMIGPGHDAWITSAEGTEAYEVSFDKADIWHD